MKSVKEFIRNNKKEVLIGVIVFIITSLLSTIYNAIKDSAPEVAQSVLSLFRGIVYTSAAKQDTDSLISLLIFGGLGFGLGWLTIFVIKSIKTTNKDIKLGEELLNDIERAKRGEKNALSSEQKKPENLIERSIKEAKEIKRLLIALASSALFAVLFIVLTSFLPNSLWNTFRRDMTMIAPYADDKVIMALQSDWVRMKTKEDYLDIYRTINEIKKANSLP